MRPSGYPAAIFSTSLASAAGERHPLTLVRIVLLFSAGAQLHCSWSCSFVICEVLECWVGICELWADSRVDLPRPHLPMQTVCVLGVLRASLVVVLVFGVGGCASQAGPGLGGLPLVPVVPPLPAANGGGPGPWPRRRQRPAWASPAGGGPSSCRRPADVAAGSACAVGAVGPGGQAGAGAGCHLGCRGARRGEAPGPSRRKGRGSGD